MTIKQAGTYYEHAKVFGNDAVLDCVSKECSGSASCGEPGPDLYKKTDAEFWLNVLDHNGGARHPASSQRISLFLDQHYQDGTVTADSFYELTKEDALPVIACKAALRFLKHAETIPLSENQMANLHQRCSEGFHDSAHTMQPQEMEEALSQLSSSTLSKLLTDTMFDHVLPSRNNSAATSYAAFGAFGSFGAQPDHHSRRSARSARPVFSRPDNARSGSNNL